MIVDRIVREIKMEDQPPHLYPLIAAKAKALSIETNIDHTIPYPKRQRLLLWLQRCTRPDISQSVAFILCRNQFSRSFTLDG
jgi:hypothetical protein